jgi:hypothetical protein
MTRRVTIRIDGAAHTALEGQSLAGLLMSLQIPARASVNGEPRTPFCGMGVCGECRVSVDRDAAVLACLVGCRDGMSVETLG